MSGTSIIAQIFISLTERLLMGRKESNQTNKQKPINSNNSGVAFSLCSVYNLHGDH